MIKCYNFFFGCVMYGNLCLYNVLGLIGMVQDLGCVFLGKCMMGYMGDVMVMVQNFEIVCIDVECKLLFVKGVILGVKGGKVFVMLVVKIKGVK